MRRARKAAMGLAAGLLLAAPLAAADPVTVAALGDSLTQGYGLPDGQGFVPRLQAWLDARGADVRLINAGVSGDTTAGGLARIGWTLTTEVDALIVALGGNDVLRGIPPATARANLDGIMSAAAARDLPVLLVGIEVPGNYGPDYQAEFAAIWPGLAAEYGALHAESFLAPILDGGDRDSALRRYMQPDGIHPNAEGVARIVAALGPQVLELAERARAAPGG
jgi:acyl-CoA thioesterase I